MLTPHNPLKVIALTMGVKESIFPISWGLLKGDIFLLEHIIHFHQVGYDLQMLTDMAQCSSMCLCATGEDIGAHHSAAL